MAKIAFLGTGLIGSAFIELLLERGDEVVVWNRSAEKARPLVEKGATLATEPMEAVAGVERIHLALANDAAVDSVIEQIAAGLAPAVPIVDHSTVQPSAVLARAMRLEARGIPFLHAPVFGAPPLVRAGKATMLCAARRQAYDLYRDSLEALAGELWYVGDRLDKAAAFKLFGNLFMAFVLSGLTDLFALARALDIDAVEAHELFKHFRPDSTIDVRGARMAKGDFTPQFTLEMIRKDIGLMLDTASAANVELAVLPAIASLIDREIGDGHGGDDAGAIAASVVGPRPE